MQISGLISTYLHIVNNKMSLVAYGDSGESEQSDDEHDFLPESPITNTNLGIHDKISYDEGCDLNIREAESQASVDLSSQIFSHERIALTSTLFDCIIVEDECRNVEALHSLGETFSDQLEDDVKPKLSQEADAPKPPKKERQPTRIFIPALVSKDSCQDESSPKELKCSKYPPSQTQCGLFTLLPPPVHCAKKQFNRPLVPHSLTKLPKLNTPASDVGKKDTSLACDVHKATVTKDHVSDLSVKHKSAFNALTGHESDSDDETEMKTVGDVDFFSLESSTPNNSAAFSSDVLKDGATCESRQFIKPVGNQERTAIDSTAAADETELNPALFFPAVDSYTGLPEQASENNAGEICMLSDDVRQNCELHSQAVHRTIVDQDSHLSMSRTSHQSSIYEVAAGFSMSPMIDAAKIVEDKSVHRAGEELDIGIDSVTLDLSVEDRMSEVAGTSFTTPLSFDHSQFQRISGKRRRCPGPGEIQIIDACVDNHMDPRELMKGISEESAYQPHRKKENMPSSQQRRKKQITYLAFQAKERELELKQAWSRNRSTKVQSRSKYGF